MKWPANGTYFVLLQVVVIPLFIGMLNWILIGSAYWQHWTTFGLATGITVAIAVSNFLVNSALVHRMRRGQPDPSQYLAKRARQFVVTVLVSSSHFSLPFFIYHWIGLPGFTADPRRLGFGVLFTILTDAFITVAYESLHNFGYWKQSRLEVETLNKARVRANLDALRQQVNPHFLFNSLNSLISLIDEDPKQAGTYAEELSTVYRYLLRSNETPLVSLGSELAFINSYYYLLKLRHGDSLTLITQISPELEERQLPPLTLQLLIENAVKHNIILPEQPLTIILRSNDQQSLIVSNNLQRKPSRALSNGVGLSNILNQYEMLGQPVPTIDDDGREFRVTLPLL